MENRPKSTTKDILKKKLEKKKAQIMEELNNTDDTLDESVSTDDE